MKQARKNKILAGSVLLLILVSIGLYFFSNREAEQIDPTIFRLSDPKTINKVVFQRDSSKVELEFLNNQWRVNKTYDADRGLVDVLFATVAQAVPKRAAAVRVRDSVLQTARTRGVKTLFYAGQSLEKAIWVWGDEATGVTYFIENEEDKPYVMVIPGYKVFVGGIFGQEAETWRDKRIFNFSWRNFTELSATFPNDPKQDFTVTMASRYFSIADMNDVDTTALNNYLDAVSLIEADAFYTPGESSKYDSLLQTKPIMNIQVKEISGMQYTLELFTIIKDERNALARWGKDYVWFDRRNIVQLYKKKKDFKKQ